MFLSDNIGQSDDHHDLVAEHLVRRLRDVLAEQAVRDDMSEEQMSLAAEPGWREGWSRLRHGCWMFGGNDDA
jgi:hypothetical protein